MGKIKNWKRIEEYGDFWRNTKAEGNQVHELYIGYRTVCLSNGKIIPQYTVWAIDKNYKYTLQRFTNKRDAREYVMNFMRNNPEG